MLHSAASLLLNLQLDYENTYSIFQCFHQPGRVMHITAEVNWKGCSKNTETH